MFEIRPEMKVELEMGPGLQSYRVVSETRPIPILSGKGLTFRDSKILNEIGSRSFVGAKMRPAVGTEVGPEVIQLYRD